MGRHSICLSSSSNSSFLRHRFPMGKVVTQRTSPVPLMGLMSLHSSHPLAFLWPNQITGPNPAPVEPENKLYLIWQELQIHMSKGVDWRTTGKNTTYHPNPFYFKLKQYSITLLEALEDCTENLINLLDLNVGFSTDWQGKLKESILLFQAPVPASGRWERERQNKLSFCDYWDD